MTSPQAEEEGVLREWAPLSKFLRQIPLRTRLGIFLESVNFTCVAADIDCIAVGTSSGHVFWYNRVTHDVQQLRSEKSLSPITSVATVSSVEFMVAAGDKLGVITIFRIPKELPEWASQPPQKQSIERYNIDELHSSRITALTWSMNGLKLFSGDESGVVVFTEVDHRMSITRACEVVNEKFKIVQLSYSQHQQALVVATDLRVIICHYNKPNWKIIQVGQRDRHCLQELGATFVVDETLKTSVYCCRTGLRLWKSSLEGNVELTIKFKGVVESANNPVKLLRPLKPVKKTGNNHLEFGTLHCWRDGLLISHWLNTLIVFDPTSVRVVATLKDCDAVITSVATTQKEIFLILGNRELIRLSYSPDAYESSLGGVGNLAAGEPVSGIPNFSFNPITGLPLITSPVQSSARVKLTAKTANSQPRANEVSYGVDSTVLLPSVVAMSEGVPELRLDSSRQHQFSSIGQEEFDEIIFTKHKRKKSRRSRSIVLDNNRNSGEFNSDDYASESGSSLAGSMIEVECELEQPASVLEFDACSLPVHLLPDVRPIEEIVEDFKMKEELLESSIIFPPPLEDLSPPSESNITIVEVMDVPNGSDLNVDEVESSNPPDAAQAVSEMTEEWGCDLSDGRERNSEGSCDLMNCNEGTHPKESIMDSPPTYQDVLQSSARLDVHKPTDDLEQTYVGLENNHKGKLELEQTFVGIENGNIPIETPVLFRSYSDIESLNSSEFSCTTVESAEDVVVDEEPVDLVENLSMCDIAQSSAETPLVDYVSAASEPVSSPEEIAPTYPILYNNLSGGWTELSCPDQPSCIASYCDGVVMCSPTFQSYFCETNCWVKLPFEASHIFVSPDGLVGVKIHYSSAYYSNDWRSKNHWKLLSRSVDSVYMQNDKLWFVSQGELYFMLFCSELVDKIDCPYKLIKIFGDGEALFAINSEHRLITQKGQEWSPVWTFQEKIEHFCYGPNKLYWVIDHNDKIFVIEDVMKGRFWWQAIVADFKPHQQLTFAANDTTIYFASPSEKAVVSNSTSVTAISWAVSGVKVDCVQMSTEGVFEDKGCVWVLCKGNRLIGIPSTIDSIVHHVRAPCKIVCLASRPQALWLLSEDGEIYVKQGINDDNPLGADWKKMSSEQLREKQLQISFLSCGVDVVWACDIRGNILMLVGSPHAISNCSYTPAWVLVEGSALQGHTFTKVYVGPQCHMVWALDNAGNVYVREAIYPDLPVGTSWVHVPGLKASHLTISAETVWALGHGGIYKRTGISESNFIGDTWSRVDKVADHLSVSVDEKLMSIEDGRIRVYTEMVFPFSDEVLVEKDWTLL